MRIMVTVVALTLCLTYALGQTAETPKGNAKNGEAIYMKTGCNQCHGNEGQGGGAGPRLGPAPMMAFKAFASYVRAPRDQMPPYTVKVMSDQDLADIYAYLAARPRPPAVNTIPALQP